LIFKAPQCGAYFLTSFLLELINKSVGKNLVNGMFSTELWIAQDLLSAGGRQKSTLCTSL
jgi:hypothetical protein